MLRSTKSVPFAWAGTEINSLAILAVGSTATETSALNANVVRLMWVPFATATSNLHITTGATAATTDTILVANTPETFSFLPGSQIRALAIESATGPRGALYVSGGLYG